MGCWNKTCGLSKLHIHHGTETMVFVLEANHRSDDRCYATAFYGPVLTPFYSIYDDYGGGEKSHGIAFNLIMAGLKKNMVEKEIGDNEYHDIAVKKDEMGEVLFFEAVHEKRLFIQDRAFGGERMVEFVMFRKDIVDDIFDNYEIKKYVGGGLGTCGYDNAYIKYKFADVLADVPAFLDLIDAKIAEKSKDDESGMSRFPWFIGEMGDIVKWNHPNKASWYARGDNYRFSHIFRPGETIIKMMLDGMRVEAEELLTEYLKGAFLNSFMEDTRNHWMPGGHEGSQGDEHGGYQALIGAMSRALTAEKAKYEEDNGN